MNKYTRWYNNITEQAKSRIIDGYTEKHHIVPRSLGGNDDASNLVNLTAREHFVCHWLLTKITKGEDRAKMLLALQMMKGQGQYQQRYNTKITARVYNTIREEVGRVNSERNKGRVQPLEENIKQRAAQTGRKRAPFTDEWRAKMSASKLGENNNRYGVELSESTKQKIGNKIRGRVQTEEEKAKRSLANIGKVKPKKLCPHCQQLIAVNGYARWHGDNCTSKL